MFVVSVLKEQRLLLLGRRDGPSATRAIPHGNHCNVTARELRGRCAWQFGQNSSLEIVATGIRNLGGSSEFTPRLQSRLDSVADHPEDHLLVGMVLVHRITVGRAAVATAEGTRRPSCCAGVPWGTFDIPGNQRRAVFNASEF